MKKNEKKCTHCGVLYKEKEIIRVFGEESAVVLGGFCSAKCYTDSESKKIDEKNYYENLLKDSEVKPSIYNKDKPRIFAICSEEGIEKLFWDKDKAKQDALEFRKDFPNALFWIEEIFPS